MGNNWLEFVEQPVQDENVEDDRRSVNRKGAGIDPSALGYASGIRGDRQALFYFDPSVRPLFSL